MNILTGIVLISVAFAQNVFCGPLAKNENLPVFVNVNATNVVYRQFEYEYYVDDETSAWQNAVRVCIVNGYDGLARIETEEQWTEIRRILAGHGVGETYWIDGLWDGVIWRWSNGEPVPSWPTWEAGHPRNAYTNRLAIQYFNQFVASWLSDSNSEVHKFICQKAQLLTEPVPCKGTNDLVVLLDSSGSIGNPNYEIAKDFVARLELAYREHVDNRLGFVIYSTLVSTIFDVLNVLTVSEMEVAIRGATYMELDTNTAAGIYRAGEILINNRRNLPMNMVLLTDGESNINPEETKVAADWAIANGVRMFAVGITDAINQQELLDIAGGKPDRVFYTDDFDKLLSLLRPVSLRVCEG